MAHQLAVHRAGESNGRFIGIQVQFAASWKPTRHITALLHVVQFWAGDVVDDAGGGDQQYFHLGLSYLF